MLWIIILAIVGVLVFLFIAPLFSVFQSKGSPGEVIEKLALSTTEDKGKKVLVAYSTRHGSTSSIAEKIGETIANNGFSVDVRPIQNITLDDLSGYDAYVMGSGVIWSKLMPNFQEFLAKYKEVWQKKPTALYAVCLTIQRDTEANRKRVKNYIEDSIKHIPEFQPLDRVAFAGRVDMDKLTFFERFALKAFFLVTPQKGGDHRDMNKVSAWAEKVSNAF